MKESWGCNTFFLNMKKPWRRLRLESFFQKCEIASEVPNLSFLRIRNNFERLHFQFLIDLIILGAPSVYFSYRKNIRSPGWLCFKDVGCHLCLFLNNAKNLGDPLGCERTKRLLELLMSFFEEYKRTEESLDPQCLFFKNVNESREA